VQARPRATTASILMLNISKYFGSGHNSSATRLSSVSACLRTASISGHIVSAQNFM